MYRRIPIPCKFARLVTGICLSTVLLACGGGGGGSGSNGVHDAEPTTDIPTTSGLQPVSGEEWDETAVRKVLHVFAYGGHATDDQIAIWEEMAPADAVAEMLTFNFTNPKLSPAQDASTQHAGSLEELQNFWGGDSPDNPMRWDKRQYYSTLTKLNDGTTTGFSKPNLQRVWIQAVNTRGINPFLHKVAFFLTNYQMAIRASLATNGLTRSYYDQIMDDLASGRSMTTIIANASKSAAVAMRYIHRNNYFDNRLMTFRGNDDFAREYFQLFFRFLGESEDPEYHENVNIENNARLLTGMQVDRIPNAYGSIRNLDYVIAPIVFNDHFDAFGRPILNITRHHADCLEIMHAMVCGLTAEQKIVALSSLMTSNQEVMDSLPLYIIGHFADDRLTDSKKDDIRTEWADDNDDLLAFLRAYAISTAFHSPGTVKFASTFSRNMTLYNKVILDNEEAFTGRDAPRDTPWAMMRNQGGEVFEPAHDVFGSQTGLEAAVNPGIFKAAYNESTETSRGLVKLESEYYTDQSETAIGRWEEDWSKVIPSDGTGRHIAADTAEWLWQHLVSDGGKNFDIIAFSQVLALLTHGYDFGYLVTQLAPSVSTDPEARYTTSELTSNPELSALLNNLASQTLALDSSDAATKRQANHRVNLATRFIAMTPYTFALEGR